MYEEIIMGIYPKTELILAPLLIYESLFCSYSGYDVIHKQCVTGQWPKSMW